MHSGALFTARLDERGLLNEGVQIGERGKSLLGEASRRTGRFQSRHA